MTMMNHRNAFSSLAASALLFLATQAHAAAPEVEIVAMPHPPVKAALAPLRDWLATQGRKITVKEIDSESEAGMRRMQSVGLSGHIPVLILIDGQYRIPRKDGSTLELVNFPNQPNTPAGARGVWTTDELRAVLTEKIK